MNVLLIKTSSMGDVFHTLPALTDALAHIPDLKIDWVVEEGFSDIPTWHTGVNEVIPIAWRRWRKQLSSSAVRQEMKAFYQRLRIKEYDLVLDAQGLIKSSIITSLARGAKHGLDRQSAKEGLSAWAYNEKHTVEKGAHAIQRVRQLFSQVFNYPLTNLPLDYGIKQSQWSAPETSSPYVVFLHGTTWTTKLWPVEYWKQLADLAVKQGYDVMLPWGNEEERERAEVIAAGRSGVTVMPKLSISALMPWLAYAKGVAGVDTGLSHVVAALAVPAVAIYGATDAVLTGVLGPKVNVIKSNLGCAPCLNKQCNKPQQNIYPPCYQEISPQRVWDGLGIEKLV